VSWRRQARITAALTGALLAAGLSGIVVAAAQSREGHPLYQAHLAAVQIGTVLPQTGAAADPASGPRHHRSKLLSHRVHGGPDGLRTKATVHRTTASKKVAVFERVAAPTPPRQVTAHKPHGPVRHRPHRAH
jgi:hypothetical protein